MRTRTFLTVTWFRNIWFQTIVLQMSGLKSASSSIRTQTQLPPVFAEQTQWSSSATPYTINYNHQLWQMVVCGIWTLWLRTFWGLPKANALSQMSVTPCLGTPTGNHIHFRSSSEPCRSEGETIANDKHILAQHLDMACCHPQSLYAHHLIWTPSSLFPCGLVPLRTKSNLEHTWFCKGCERCKPNQINSYFYLIMHHIRLKATPPLLSVENSCVPLLLGKKCASPH